MTINFKTNVKTVIRYKGQEFSSADQLPAEARAAYESALGKGVAAAAAPETKQQIVLNGQHFTSPDEMPAAERKLYDAAISCVRENATLSAAPKSSSSWLTPVQWLLVLFAAAIIVLVALARLFS
jgi:hypothetical protein